MAKTTAIVQYDENANERLAVSWTDYSALRWSGIDRPSSRSGKLGITKVLTDLGLPHLQVLKKFDRAADVDLSNLPDVFVLKPEALWSSKGVMLLHKVVGTPHYFDAKNNKIYLPDDVRRECIKLETDVKKTLKFMVEERAIDENLNNIIPLDYKVFTFYGETKFVLQVDRNHQTPKLAFFDGQFRPILDDRVSIPSNDKETRGTPIKPSCADGILKIAIDITKHLSAPFISVDCYATQSGAMFGELTHTPGGPWYASMYRFSDDFDRELGSAWTNARHRLGLPQSKILSPYRIGRGKSVKRTIS